MRNNIWLNHLAVKLVIISSSFIGCGRYFTRHEGPSTSPLSPTIRSKSQAYTNPLPPHFRQQSEKPQDKSEKEISWSSVDVDLTSDDELIFDLNNIEKNKSENGLTKIILDSSCGTPFSPSSSEDLVIYSDHFDKLNTQPVRIRDFLPLGIFYPINFVDRNILLDERKVINANNLDFLNNLTTECKLNIQYVFRDSSKKRYHMNSAKIKIYPSDSGLHLQFQPIFLFTENKSEAIKYLDLTSPHGLEQMSFTDIGSGPGSRYLLCSGFQLKEDSTDVNNKNLIGLFQQNPQEEKSQNYQINDINDPAQICRLVIIKNSPPHLRQYISQIFMLKKDTSRAGKLEVHSIFTSAELSYRQDKTIQIAQIQLNNTEDFTQQLRLPQEEELKITLMSQYMNNDSNHKTYNVIFWEHSEILAHIMTDHELAPRTILSLPPHSNTVLKILIRAQPICTYLTHRSNPLLKASLQGYFLSWTSQSLPLQKLNDNFLYSVASRTSWPQSNLGHDQISDQADKRNELLLYPFGPKNLNPNTKFADMPFQTYAQGIQIYRLTTPSMNKSTLITQAQPVSGQPVALPRSTIQGCWLP